MRELPQYPDIRVLPVIRSGERMCLKRCEKKWFWEWRKGLVPRTVHFGALDLGTWTHTALANWYGKGLKRNGKLADQFMAATTIAMEKAASDNVPDYAIEQAQRLILLGEAMTTAYERFYGRDREIRVLDTEIPLEFVFSRESDGHPLAVHKLKPDAVFMDLSNDVWLMEHKTAASVQTEHLVIDDQARPYGAMAERALRKLGVINNRQRFKGILYNFLRKVLPDEREQNAKGQYLNKNGTVSKRQPPPIFVRKPVVLTAKSKMITLQRVQRETQKATLLALELRTGEVKPDQLNKTPHKSCPKTCQFFSMCVAEEEGTDIRDMERTMFYRRDPYKYEEESTEDPLGFEIG
jgi:hypothetical protein